MERVLNLTPIKRIDNLLADRELIPFSFQSATLLAALAHPDHLLLVGSWGFTYLPPSSNSLNSIFLCTSTFCLVEFWNTCT
ncbi:MAG: hypothetical protein QS721_07735 [Candidatus Endonucleobacter sp. (ex Gigantidas childressi)]|nr:hypothetical protein [Candidatus Endonucleobacter sp. (ex Gigantidas childressi)]